jgi:hypothetical protein
MAISRRRNSSSRGIKFITAALGHRRGDKYLFANKQEYIGKSYRALWLQSRSTETFETWLKIKGILAA